MSTPQLFSMRWIGRRLALTGHRTRLIYHLRPHDHITDALTTLHWLGITECAQYKIVVLTFKAFHDSAPRYLWPIVAVADLPGRRALRSASTNRPDVAPFKLSTVGSRAFPVTAAKSGTVCRKLSLHRHHWRASAVNWRLIFSGMLKSRDRSRSRDQFWWSQSRSRSRRFWSWSRRLWSR